MAWMCWLGAEEKWRKRIMRIRLMAECRWCLSAISATVVAFQCRRIILNISYLSAVRWADVVSLEVEPVTIRYFLRYKFHFP